MISTEIRRAAVLGCGLIGASVALALRRTGVHVTLSDRDPYAVRKAERMGAGTASAHGDRPADVVIIATPPSTVPGVLREAQDRGLGRVYTDVASTKAGILAEAEAAGCDVSVYVPGHPMAGGESSGPGAARADLFAGRRWALCPHPATRPEAVRLVTELVALCGAEHRLIRPDAHDRITAAVSHVPHLMAAALAARFAGADETTLALAGQGLRDVTRIAGGSPDLWCDILRQNAGPIAEVLDAVVRDLAEVASALREASSGVAMTSGSPGLSDAAMMSGVSGTSGVIMASGTPGISGALADLLVRGNRGRALLAGARPAGAAGRQPAAPKAAA
ncbi:prephenate dehydrogenase [Streptosporangium sp. NPDC048047]|uniref:prephenate dehydrogenase n=1 Tax=Streptosporangium sp. NPDC048047 TaxID=3155748 RepID=UPI0034131B36